MREIAGPGAVGGQFVDYDAINNPNGTVYTADHGNDVQNDLIAMQDYLSIPEAAGTSAYVLAATIGISVMHGKELGEMYFLDSLKTPVAFDKDAPTTFFPGKCLDAIAIFEDLAVANWPLLVPHLRAKGLTYNEGITGEKSSFDVTDWDITSNVGTLTFANTTAENAILAALVEDNLVHGSYTDWRSITLAGSIGDITAGEYAITAIDATLRTVKFAFTAGDNSGSGAFTINFYTNRVPGSTTTARLYQATARTLVSANDDDGENINGLRRRDRYQEHFHQINVMTAGGASTGFPGAIGSANIAPGTPSPDPYVTGSITDGATIPQIGKTTDPRSAVGHLYIHGRSYV